jgi:hypothetical protein
MEDAYIQSLASKELIAYDIAKRHLGMSFCLAKSNGYLAWRRKEDETLKRKYEHSQLNANKKK